MIINTNLFIPTSLNTSDDANSVVTDPIPAFLIVNYD